MATRTPTPADVPPSVDDGFRSLPVQVAEKITAEIAAKTWVGWLPGERALAETLQVSRKTVRKALALLEHRGVVRTEHGVGHAIVSTRVNSRRARSSLSVGLLTQGPLEQLRPFTALWVDKLRALLTERNIRFVLLAGHRFFTRHPERALTRLVEHNPMDCWVLIQSNEAVQHWFADRRVRCVIAGSAHSGLALPSVDLDYFALCRHAVGAMLRHGHRRIAFLTLLSQRAGDLESESGFAAGARMPAYPGVTAEILRHDGSVRGVERILHRILERSSPPTAMLVSNPAYYLSVIALLARRGLRVPEDISLVCRDDDTFLSFLVPEPARYSCNPTTFAKQLLGLLLQSLRGTELKSSQVLIEPKYRPGPSLRDLVVP
jgi:DNA-binding LacI/PurR family transcriptional regulator